MKQIRVGTGKAKIDVPEELYPFPIYENFSFDGMGTAGSLYARAIVVDNGEDRFLFVGTDVADAPGLEMRQKIEKACSIPVDHMYVTATHNHSAPHGGGRNDGGVNKNPEKKEKEAAYRGVYEQGILQAVEQALTSLRPALYGYGEGKSYVNVNRNARTPDGYWTQGQNFAGPSDKTLAALKFTDEKGQLIGAVVNYACHGTSAFCSLDTDGKIKVTPGFMGIASAYSEQWYGDDAVILWTNGASGDQNPIICSEGFPLHFEPDGEVWPEPLPPGSNYMIQKHLGGVHGTDIIRTLDSISAEKKDMPITVAKTSVSLGGQKPPEGADMPLNKLFIDNTVRLYRPELCVDGKPPEKHLVEMLPADPVSMDMYLAVLGDSAWIGIAGEPYTTIGMKCKAASPLKNTAIVLHVDDVDGAGYIPDDASAEYKVFQAYSKVRPGHVDDVIVDGVRELFKKAEL